MCLMTSEAKNRLRILTVRLQSTGGQVDPLLIISFGTSRNSSMKVYLSKTRSRGNFPGSKHTSFWRQNLVSFDENMTKITKKWQKMTSFRRQNDVCLLPGFIPRARNKYIYLSFGHSANVSKFIKKLVN